VSPSAPDIDATSPHRVKHLPHSHAGLVDGADDNLVRGMRHALQVAHHAEGGSAVEA
jgi:hypothetical protein